MPKKRLKRNPIQVQVAAASSSVGVPRITIGHLHDRLINQIAQWLHVDELCADFGRVNKQFHHIATSQVTSTNDRALHLRLHKLAKLNLSKASVTATAPFRYNDGIKPDVPIYVAGHKLKHRWYRGERGWSGGKGNGRYAISATHLTYDSWNRDADPQLVECNHRLKKWMEEKDMVRKVTLIGPWMHSYEMLADLPFDGPEDDEWPAAFVPVLTYIGPRFVLISGSEGKSIRDIRRIYVKMLMWAIGRGLFV